MESLVTSNDSGAINLMAKADKLYNTKRINEKGYCTLRALATGLLSSAEQLSGVSHAGILDTFSRISEDLARNGYPHMVTKRMDGVLTRFGFSSRKPSVIATEDPETFMTDEYMRAATQVYALSDTCRPGDFLAQLRTLRGMYILWKAEVDGFISKDYTRSKVINDWVKASEDQVANQVTDLIYAVGLA